MDAQKAVEAGFDLKLWLPAFAAIGAAVIAAGASIASSVFVYRSTNKRIRVDVVTSGRQKWIDALREDLSELLEVRSGLIEYIEASDDSPLTARIRKDPDRFKDLKELSKKLQRLRARILLRLDISDKKDGRQNLHRPLADAIDSLCDDPDDYFPAWREDVLRYGRAVIDAAWQQIKDLK